MRVASAAIGGMPVSLLKCWRLLRDNDNNNNSNNNNDNNSPYNDSNYHISSPVVSRQDELIPTLNQIHKHAKRERGQYPAILTEQALSMIHIYLEKVTQLEPVLLVGKFHGTAVLLMSRLL